jgi:hypothetical protein
MNARQMSGSAIPGAGERIVGPTTGPTTAAIAEAIAFWVVAVALAVLTSGTNQPGWVWALRVITIAAGVGVAGWLIAREKARERRGLPIDRDASPFDLWTIAHTIAGLVMGAWGVPGPLVLVFTIAWEIFEWQVPGFGEGEIPLNRVVDVAVACVGWFVVAGLIAGITGHEMPWLLPAQDSLIRGGGLHLF